MLPFADSGLVSAHTSSMSTAEDMESIKVYFN